jgi:hypothetical protein
MRNLADGFSIAGLEKGENSENRSYEREDFPHLALLI